MNLTDEQKQIVAGWIRDGAGLNDVQKRLRDELEVSLTYLDTRLLVAELNLVPAEKPKEPDAQDVANATTAAAAEGKAEQQAGEGAVPGQVAVTIDEIVRPNAMISGKVTFSDGERADWYVDSMGRLGLDPTTPGYRPSQEDVMTFQVELQNLARQQGL